VFLCLWQSSTRIQLNQQTRFVLVSESNWCLLSRSFVTVRLYLSAKLLKEQMEQQIIDEVGQVKKQCAEREKTMQTEMNKQRLQLQALQSQLVAVKLMGASADITPKVCSIDGFGAQASRSRRRVVCATADQTSRKSRKSGDVRQTADRLSRMSLVRCSLDRRTETNSFTLAEVQQLSAFISSVSAVESFGALVRTFCCRGLDFLDSCPLRVA
jgi:hypothetical protein